MTNYILTITEEWVVILCGWMARFGMEGSLKGLHYWGAISGWDCEL